MKMLLKLVACIALLVSNTAAQSVNESELSLCVCINIGLIANVSSLLNTVYSSASYCTEL